MRVPEARKFSAELRSLLLSITVGGVASADSRTFPRLLPVARPLDAGLPVLTCPAEFDALFRTGGAVATVGREAEREAASVVVEVRLPLRTCTDCVREDEPLLRAGVAFEAEEALTGEDFEAELRDSERACPALDEGDDFRASTFVELERLLLVLLRWASASTGEKPASSMITRSAPREERRV